MDDEPLNHPPDMSLAYLTKQDLYTLSVSDLEERIVSLRDEITRCEKAIGDRGSSRSAADELFKI